MCVKKNNLKSCLTNTHANDDHNDLIHWIKFILVICIIAVLCGSVYCMGLHAHMLVSSAEIVRFRLLAQFPNRSATWLPFSYTNVHCLHCTFQVPVQYESNQLFCSYP